MICKFCGKQAEDGDKVCRYCGSMLDPINNDTKTEKYTDETEIFNTESVRRSSETPGFENSRRVARAADEQHDGAKRQYYRYNPNGTARRTQNKNEQHGTRRRRRSREKMIYPKRVNKERHIGRAVLKIVMLAVLGFILGLLIYFITMNVSGWIGNIRDRSGSVPSAVQTTEPSSSESSGNSVATSAPNQTTAPATNAPATAKPTESRTETREDTGSSRSEDEDNESTKDNNQSDSSSNNSSNSSSNSSSGSSNSSSSSGASESSSSSVSEDSSGGLTD